jgi:hypothetical protein
LSATVAFLVSYYAYKTNRLLENQFLRFISIGFMLLGVGLGTEGLTQGAVGLTLVQAARFSGLEKLVFLIDIVLQLVAYASFALGYALSAFGRVSKLEVLAPATAAAVERRVLQLFVYSINIFLTAQIGIIILLLFVVAQGFLAYARNSSGLALTVIAGFMLILISHVILFFSVVYLSSGVFLIGTFVQFLGFVSLVFFLYRSSRIGST